MRERGRALIIFVPLFLLLGGGLYYLLGVYRPGQARDAARAEIADWEARYAKARICLVGAKQASAAIAEAIGVHELGPDPWDRTNCTRLIGVLTRGDAEPTELDAVERVWQEIDHSAGVLAQAFVKHVQRYLMEPAEETAKMAKAVEAMDAARDRLRIAAGLPPIPPATKATLPRVVHVPISLDAEPLMSVTRHAVSSNTVLAWSAAVQMIVEVGKPPRVLRLAPGVERSFPDIGWGAGAAGTGIASGDVDVNGGMVPTATLALQDVEPRLLFALGNATQGLVAYTVPWDSEDVPYGSVQLGLARAKAGKLEAEPLRPTVDLVHAITPAGRAVLAWTDASDAMHGTILTPDAVTPTKVIEIGSGNADTACLTDKRAWVGGREQIISFDDAGAVPRLLAGFELVQCGADAALLRKRSTTTFAVCPNECRTAELPDANPAGVPALVGDRVFVVASLGHVIGVWRERAAPVYFTISTTFSPLRAISDGKKLDVLGRTPKGFAIISLPAS